MFFFALIYPPLCMVQFFMLSSPTLWALPWAFANFFFLILHGFTLLLYFSINYTTYDKKRKIISRNSAEHLAKRTAKCSNRPCAIPKSVSGSGINTIVFTGVYLGNYWRCGYCISLIIIGNFRCTFIQ